MNSHNRFQHAPIYAKHGLVLFDTDAIFKLSPVIPAALESSDRKPRHLWDIARYLGRVHFKAAVTEISAFIAGGTLRDGETVHSHFHSQHSPCTFERHALLNTAHKSGDIPIVAAADNDGTAAALYMRRIFDIHSDTQADKIHRLVEAQKNMPVDFSAAAAIKLIASTHINGDPIFFVSDSIRNIDMVRRAKNLHGSPVHAISMYDFISGSIQAGIPADMKLQIGNADELIQVIYEHFRLNGMGVHVLRGTNYTNEENRTAFAKAIMESKGAHARARLQRQQYPTRAARP